MRVGTASRTTTSIVSAGGHSLEKRPGALSRRPVSPAVAVQSRLIFPRRAKPFEWEVTVASGWGEAKIHGFFDGSPVRSVGVDGGQ